MLGALGDHVEAQPWVIILCHEKAFKKVKQFFCQEWVRSHHKPPEGADFPLLRILVANRSPIPISLIYGPSLMTSNCLPPGCGTPFRVDVDKITRFGSIGGIIMAKTREGSTEFYGMTAGHVFESEIVDTSSPATPKSLGDTFSSSEDNGSREYDLRFPFIREENGNVTNSSDNSSSGTSSSCWPALGDTWSSSFANPDGSSTQNLDWCLISFKDVSLYYPSAFGEEKLSGPKEASSTALREDLLYLTARRHGDRPVETYCGMSGRKEGSLTMTFSYLMLAPGQRLVKTYCLALSDETGKLS